VQVLEFRCFLKGDVDVASAGRLHSDLDAAIAANEGTLVVDCSELTFIDAAGVNILIAAHRKLQRDGRGFRVENLKPLYRRIFEMLDLAEEFGIQPSASSARPHPSRRRHTTHGGPTDDRSDPRTTPSAF
jgi:anti-sigma B factor antagonist